MHFYEESVYMLDILWSLFLGTYDASPKWWKPTSQVVTNVLHNSPHKKKITNAQNAKLVVSIDTIFRLPFSTS